MLKVGKYSANISTKVKISEGGYANVYKVKCSNGETLALK
jgi:hypothetical protein